MELICKLEKVGNNDFIDTFNYPLIKDNLKDVKIFINQLQLRIDKLNQRS